ncbi:MAG: methyl-accepting chemotaxis protein [Halanaerobium sp.]|nr:methyl-accepting chemotaxis protein [Halanaerobium sp.]
MNKSIKTKLILVFVLLIAVLLVGSSLVTYNQSQAILHESINANAKNQASDNARIITEWLEGMEQQAVALANTDSIRMMQWIVVESQMIELVERDDAVEIIYMADTEGNYQATTGGSGSIADRSYFQEAIETGEPVVSDPIINKETGTQSIAIAAPIKDKAGNVLGILGYTVKLDYLQNLVAEMKISGYGNGWIINKDMTTIAHPVDEYMGNKTILEEGNQELRDIASDMAAGKTGVKTYSLQGTEKFLAYAPVKLTGWSVAISAPVDQVLQPLNTIKRSSILIGAIAIILGLIVTFFVASYLAKPIVSLSKVAEVVAEGDLTQQVEVQTKDEIGRLAGSFNKMIENLQDMVERIIENAQLTSSTSQELAATSEETSASIEEVASSIQEFSATTEQISVNTQNMAEAASEVNNLTDEGLEFMGQTQSGLEEVLVSSAKSKETINSLNEATEEIKGIVEVISSIADQTSLLALNAAIEAARAGDQGRGFAVVADEVRELAEESQKSAGNIQQLIEGLIGRTREAVAIIEENDNKIETRVQDVNKTSDIFAEIGDKVTALVSQIEEVAAATQQFAGSTEEVSAASEEQSASMEQISSSAQQLAVIAQELNELVNQFKV